MSMFENIAEELKKLRQQQGGAQEDLARNLGISFAHRQSLGKRKNQTVPPRSRKD